MAQQIISIPWKTFKDKTPELDKPLFIQVLGLCKSTTLEYFSAYVSSKTLEVIPLNGNKQPLTLDPERADTYLWAYMDEVFSVMLPDGSDDSKFGKQDYLPCVLSRQREVVSRDYVLQGRTARRIRGNQLRLGWQHIL